MQNDRPGANQAVVINRTAFKMGVVADDAAVTNDGWMLSRAMNNGAVLNGGLRSNPDGTMVTAKHSARPDCRFRTNRDVTNDDCVGVHEGGGIDGGNSITKGINGHCVGPLNARLRIDHHIT
jgi:hypothetical protein